MILDEKYSEFYLMCITDSIVSNPLLRNDMIELYRTDKFRFYERAKQSTYYDDEYVCGRTLQAEVEIKRVFGIILCAEDDEELRTQILKLISKQYYKIFQTIKKVPQQLTAEIKKNIDNSTNYESQNSLVRLPFYMMYLYYGPNCELAEYQRLKKHCSLDAHEIFTNMAKKKSDLSALKAPISFYPTKDVLNAVNSVSALSGIWDILDDFESPFTRNVESFVKNEKNQRIVNDIAFAYGYLARLLDSEHLSISQVIGKVSLTKTDISNIITLAYITAVSRYDTSKLSDFLTAERYSYGILMLSLIKEYKKVREFYFENNSETLFLEIKSLQDGYYALKKENQDLKANIEFLKNRVAQYDKENAKTKSQIEEPLLAEVRQLNESLKKLQSDFDSEREKSEELNRLREFMFDVQSDYEPEEQGINASLILSQKAPKR